MDRPLEIAFHNLDPSPAIETMIRDHVEKLDKLAGRLIACRVSLEGLHKQHLTGNVYECHITLSLPGREISISRGPHRPKEKYARPDARTSVREAFEAAERQLLEHKRQLREDTTPPTGSAVGGRILQIEPGADHGFLETPTGTQLYFHRDSVTNGRFEDLREGQLVHYVDEEGDAGPVATKVRVIEPKE